MYGRNPLRKMTWAAVLTAAAMFGCDDDTTASEGEADMGAGGSGAAMGEGGGGSAGGAGGGMGGEPVGGMPVGGEPVGGEPVGGEPVGGEPVGGEPMGGEPVGGEPVGGEPVGGEPVGGEPMGGEPMGGEPMIEDVPMGRINALAIANAGDPNCQDLNGDNAPDNAFALAAFLANEPLADALQSEEFNLMTAGIGLMGTAGNNQFDLGLLTADPSLEDFDTYIVDPDALDEEGEPRVLLAGATVVDGSFQAGPGDFSFSLPIGDMPAEVTLNDTLLTGTLSLPDGNIQVDGGYISGLLSQDTFDAIIAVVDPEFRDLAAGLLAADVDTNGDGINDAYSMCLSFGATPATLIGYPVSGGE